MLNDKVIRARIDGQTKEAAEIVLSAMGLTASDALRMMMRRIAAEKALPFAPLIPNAETIKAMQAARRGEVETASSVEEMFEKILGRKVYAKIRSRPKARSVGNTRKKAGRINKRRH